MSNTKRIVKVFIIGFIIGRTVFWFGGVDITIRNIHNGVAMFMSIIAGFFLVAIIGTLGGFDEEKYT